MKLFTAVKASFTESAKSVNIDDFHYTKIKIFDKKSIIELVDFLKEKVPMIDNGQFHPLNEFDHLFGDDRDRSRKFAYIISCLTDRTGQPIFRVTSMSNLTGVISVGGNKLTDISELQEKKIDDDESDDKSAKKAKK